MNINKLLTSVLFISAATPLMSTSVSCSNITHDGLLKTSCVNEDDYEYGKIIIFRAWFDENIKNVETPDSRSWATFYIYGNEITSRVFADGSTTISGIIIVTTITDSVYSFLLTVRRDELGNLLGYEVVKQV